MPRPSRNEIREAIEHPEQAFQRPDLRESEPERNRMGAPRARIGAFGMMYRLVHPRTGVAKGVRAFLSPDDERVARYRAVSEHLGGLPRPPSSLVPFEFEPEGLRVGERTLPILVLDWVEGTPLGTWVAEKVGQKDARSLRELAQQWARVAPELRANDIAHGNLDHNSIVVVQRDGKDIIKLVDYDCMCVPRLVGQDAYEAGSPAYEHPDRMGQPMSLELDRFAAWVVYTVLRAVAADWSLWTTFVEETDNEHLLVNPSDMTDPEGSALWPRLRASSDEAVRRGASLLRDALGKPFDQIPAFEAQ